MFADCIKKNILDSNHIFYFSPETESMFKEKFRKEFATQNWSKEINTDLISNCIVEKLNGNITISEYLAEDYYEVPKIKRIISECLEKSYK